MFDIYVFLNTPCALFPLGTARYTFLFVAPLFCVSVQLSKTTWELIELYPWLYRRMPLLAAVAVMVDPNTYMPR